MTLELIRLQYLHDRTLGTLHFVGDNQWHCDTLELPATINGETNVPNLCCIPAGTYELKVTWSPAFKRWLPLLMAVPGRSGIRIHAGNTPRDTKGCILVGWKYGNELLCSQHKLIELTDQLRRNETHYITIH
jgi:hypothetical protein